MNHKTRPTGADGTDSLCDDVLPPALAVLVPKEKPHKRQTRWSHVDGAPVYVDPTLPGRPTIPEALRDKIAEHGAAEVVRTLHPLSRVAVLGMAAQAQAAPWSWILCGQRLRDLYRLDEQADARKEAGQAP
jgi:hypothetical protein